MIGFLSHPYLLGFPAGSQECQSYNLTEQHTYRNGIIIVSILLHVAYSCQYFPDLIFGLFGYKYLIFIKIFSQYAHNQAILGAEACPRHHRRYECTKTIVKGKEFPAGFGGFSPILLGFYNDFAIRLTIPGPAPEFPGQWGREGSRPPGHPPQSGQGRWSGSFYACRRAGGSGSWPQCSAAPPG